MIGRFFDNLFNPDTLEVLGCGLACVTVAYWAYLEWDLWIYLPY